MIFLALIIAVMVGCTAFFFANLRTDHHIRVNLHREDLADRVLKVNKKGRVTTIRIAPKKEALSINETYTKPSTVWYREISSNKLKQISL